MRSHQPHTLLHILGKAVARNSKLASTRLHVEAALMARSCYFKMAKAPHITSPKEGSHAAHLKWAVTVPFHCQLDTISIT